MYFKDSFLVFFLIIIALKGIVWAQIFPVFQGPDEQAYFAYTQYLAEHKKRPSALAYGLGVSDQFLEFNKTLDLVNIQFNPLNHNVFSSDPFSLIAPNEELLLKSPFNTRPNPGTYAGYNYPPTYSFLNLPFYFLFKENPFAQIFAMRLFSVILSLITGFYIYSTGKELFDSESLGFAFGILLTFLPMFSHISSLLHIDVLLNLGFSAFFYYCTLFLSRKNLKASSWLKLLFFVALIFWTKTQGLFVLPLLLIFLLFRYIKNLFKGKNFLFWGLSILSIAIISFFTERILLHRFASAFSSISDVFQAHSFSWFVKAVFIDLFFRPLFFSFFASFGWLDTFLATPYYMVFALFIFASIIGFLFYIIHSFRSSKLQDFDHRYSFFLVSILFLVSAYFFLSLSEFSLQSPVMSFTQGRYFFLAIIPIFALLLRGYLSLFSKKYQNFAIFCLLFLMIFSHIISLIQYILPRYYG
ncbi:glycosyltransferase family 39 protein [Candidatus Peregrinibacteria bacterium]|nr:glycosyltransferase family 39 protein [Candidatus Peregrinibacteria bacterium]